MPKFSAAAELERAIKTVGRGEKYFSPLVSKHIVVDGAGRVSPGRAMVGQLTPRQREILQLIAERHSTKQIAEILEISVKTVETHRAMALRKLNLDTTAALIRYAIKNKLVEN